MAGLLCCGAFTFSFSFAQAEAPTRPDGEYRNNYPQGPKESFWAWKWEQLRKGVPEPPEGGWKIPTARTDAAALRANTTEPTMTWIGHASFLVQLAGKNLLFDPTFSERASPVQFAGPKRVVPLPIDVPELPRIDYVFISHSHYDHLDLDSVKRLAALPDGGPMFFVGLGLKKWFHDQGIERVVEMDWWQDRTEGPLKVTFIPVQHWSKRTLTDTNKTLWGGWVVEGGGLKIVHTGDLGYSKDAQDVGERLGPFDMAFIPIGAYAPRWFMKLMHVDVPEAVQVRSDLRAARVVGMHWGTFEKLTDEPLDEPPAELAKQRGARGLAKDAFDTMAIGETRRIERAR
ncbi:MBL fold metallo-hydrolase [Usitatibacter rugosus]|uniref:MBL fold metallo-hydrolase n=1 Tax=Usitatibacter rugosus TaxID=2732067 RepID=UPI0014888593|nr:MBL fold metallo-hydrolase [Usitatibacter rugosus]